MKVKDIDFNKSLDELEKMDSGDAPIHSTGLVQKVHELSKLPLKLWTNEDFRLMVLQQISLEYLVPIVLFRLVRNPFSSGELYTGDLFNAIVSIDEDFWKQNDDLHYELHSIIDSLEIDLETYNDIIKKYRSSYS